MSLLLLIGDRQSGKTTACRRLVELARARGLSVGGIICPAVHEGRRRVGYDVIDLSTGGSTRLATTKGPGVERVGRFHFAPEGLALGNTALSRAGASRDALVIIDEVGPLELAGGGWSRQLPSLADRPGITLMTARRALASELAKVWNVAADAIFELADDSEAVVGAILRRATALES